MKRWLVIFVFLILFCSSASAMDTDSFAKGWEAVTGSAPCLQREKDPSVTSMRSGAFTTVQLCTDGAEQIRQIIVISESKLQDDAAFVGKELYTVLNGVAESVWGENADITEVISVLLSPFTSGSTEKTETVYMNWYCGMSLFCEQDRIRYILTMMEEVN